MSTRYRVLYPLKDQIIPTQSVNIELKGNRGEWSDSQAEAVRASSWGSRLIETGVLILEPVKKEILPENPPIMGKKK